MKNYEIFEHTADIGLRIRAKSLEELFKNAGLAVFEVSTKRQYVRNKTHTEIFIKLQAEDLEELFVTWLNELLSLSSAKGLVFHNIKISKLVDFNLEAMVTGSDIGNFQVHNEIKAATYHQLRVEKTGDEWVADVILDV
ncbi:MAG: archease [Candidatus Omnitrophota bacterium]